VAILEDRYEIEGSFYEVCSLKNYIIARVSYEDICEVTFSSDSGCVTEQIYEKLNKHNIYKDMKPSGIWCYTIEIEAFQIKEFLEAVEAIDSSTLSQGVIY
jgi:hypothetical protein